MGRLSFAAQNCTWQHSGRNAQHHTVTMRVSCEHTPLQPHASQTGDVPYDTFLVHT